MTEDQRAPRPPDLHRRTLTPVGYALCVAVPILIAAIGLTFLHFNYDKEDLVDGTRLQILTADRQPGEAASVELFRGELVLDNRCTYLESAEGARTAIVWPSGFEATAQTVGHSDQLKVYDPDRSIVARSGNTIEFRGGSVPAADFAGKACAPPSGDALAVQSDVRVVGAE
jgi:hypothetical protein